MLPLNLCEQMFITELAHLAIQSVHCVLAFICGKYEEKTLYSSVMYANLSTGSIVCLLMHSVHGYRDQPLDQFLKRQLNR